MTVARRVPFLGWVREYRREWLRSDLIAGLTVVALLVPEGMAYAQLAGMPPQSAFYAAPAGLVLYATFGTSRQLVVGVSAAVAVMSAATVGAVAAPGSAQYIALTAVLALLAGAASLLFGLVRLGRVAHFFSKPVLTGFVFGLALVIAIRQAPRMLGIEAGGDDFFVRLWQIVTRSSDTHWPTAALAAATLATMLLLERLSRRIPAALVAMVLGIAASALLDLEAAGVRVVGDLPAGLAPPRIPHVALQDALLLLPGALGISLVAFAEAIGPAQQFARKHGYAIAPNRELVGLGAANIGAGLLQGFPIGSSLSKSAANDRAGAKTQMALVIAAAGSAFVALYLTPLFRSLPEATLGVIVVVSISGMMRLDELHRLFDVRRADFVVALAALGGVLWLDVLPGLLVAVSLSVLILVVRASRPDLSVMGPVPESEELADLNKDPRARPVPGLLIVRPNEGLFFANADPLRERILSLVEASDPPPRAVVVDLEMSSDLDVPSADALSELHEELVRRGIELFLSRVHAHAKETLDRSGVSARIGEDHFYRRSWAVIARFGSPRAR